MRRKVEQVFGLASRQTTEAKRRDLERGQGAGVELARDFRRRAGVNGKRDASPDRLGGLDRDLLADDRSRKRRERVAATRQANAGVLADQLFEHPVALR